MDHKEQAFSANYAQTNISLILQKLNGRSCLTILAPSGFAKSNLLRYLSFNKKYRAKYRSIRNIEFIYVDLNGTVIEKDNDMTQIWNTSESSEVITLEKVLYRSICNKSKEYTGGVHISSLDQNYSKENLISGIEELLDVYRNKIFYFILDGSERLLDNDSKEIGDLLQFIRETYKGRIEFIFTLNNSDSLTILSHQIHGRLAALMSQQIVILKMTDVSELHYFHSEGIRNLFDRIILSRLKSFKEKLKKINSLSGGYPAYFKHLLTLPQIDSSIPLTYELIAISKRLLNSLTESQVNILRMIINGQHVPQNQDLDYLVNTGIVRVNNNKLSLFSPIMAAYLRNY